MPSSEIDSSASTIDDRRNFLFFLKKTKMRLAARDVFGSKAEKENRNDDGGTRRAENG